MVVESHRLPAGIVPDGMNLYDMKLPEGLLWPIVVLYSERTNFCLDADYREHRRRRRQWIMGTYSSVESRIIQSLV
jgi:hypothetical protein